MYFIFVIVIVAHPLLSTPAQEDGFDRQEHDQQIQTNRSVLDVEQVVLKFFARICDGAAVLVLDLRPSGEAGPHHVAHSVIGNLFREPLDEFRALGTRADECHIAFEHAPQLGNFIKARDAEKLADAGHARIVIAGPLRTVGGFGVLAHGAELHDVEDASALAHPRLGIEHGPLGIEADGKHDQGEQRQSEGEPKQRDNDGDDTANHDEGGAAAKALAIHQPAGIQILDLDLAGNFFQPGGGFLDLDSLHAEVKQFAHGDGTAAIRHGDDDAMDFLFVDDFQQVRSHGVAGYRAFHFAGPTGDLDADFRVLAQALHHALRALAGTEDVNALDQNWQLDEPCETEPPSEQSDGEDDQADRRRTASQEVTRPYVGNARQKEGEHAGNHKQAEIKLTFGVEARGVVQVKPVRAQQYQHRDSEDLQVAALVVEHQVTVFAKFVHCSEQERGPDNQGLSDQQDQSTDWIIDIEEPDQRGLGSSSSSISGWAVHGLAIVVFRLRTLSGWGSVKHHSEQQLVWEFFAGTASQIGRRRIGAHDHENAVAGTGDQCGIRNGDDGRCVENDPIKQGLDALQELLQTAIGEQFGGAANYPAGRHEEQVFHGAALQGGELVAFAQQVVGQSGRLGRSEMAVHAGVAQIGVDHKGAAPVLPHHDLSQIGSHE